jgi:uncharacterized protein (TIGR02001 family)
MRNFPRNRAEFRGLYVAQASKKGIEMKKVVLSVIALAASAAPVLAADLVTKAPPAAVVAPAAPLWDIAFGGIIQSDYNFRGVSQSNRGPSAGAYFEPQYNSPIGTFYVGLAGYSIDFPTSLGFTSPSAEIDIYGGWRYTWGQLSLDLGAIDYYYPRETFNGLVDDTDYYEIYAKAAYAITPALTVGANVFWTPDLLNYGGVFTASGFNDDAAATYASLTAKWVTPWTYGDLGAYVSGEVGHWWIDDSGFKALGFGDPSYTYFNAGVAFTYKAVTLDLRYYGTDMDKQGCRDFLLIGKGNAAANWCNDTFIAAIKFDTTLNALK